MGGGWDDTFHNFYFYKRATDGKWLIIQQDFEWTYGLGGSPEIKNSESPLAPWNAKQTFYVGAKLEDRIAKECELTLVGSPWLPGWRVGACNFLGFFELKDKLIRYFRPEFDAKLKSLSKTILSPESVNKVMDAGVKEFNLQDWKESPATKACDPAKQHDVMRSWVKDRHQTLVERLMP